MAASFNVRKMYSTFEKIDGCEYSIETIIFEKTHSWNQLLLQINILLLKELVKQWMTKSSCQNKYNTLQRMYDCSKSRYISSRHEWLQLEW